MILIVAHEVHKVFQTIGDFDTMPLYSLSLFLFFSSFVLLPSCFSLFIVRHPLWIGPNEPRSRGRKKSITRIFTIHIVVFGYETPHRPFSYTPLTLFRSLILWSVDRPRLVVVHRLYPPLSFTFPSSVCHFFVKYAIVMYARIDNTL